MTFKENCPDIRNSKVVDVVRELQNYGAEVDDLRSLGRQRRVQARIWPEPVASSLPKSYDVAVVARCAPGIPRARARRACGACARRTTCVYDIKHVFAAAEVDGRL